MDDMEKRLLRKKKPLFSENIELSDEFLNMLIDSELLLPDMLQQIQKENTLNQKMGKLVDLLVTTETPDAFDKICSLLVKDYNWISKDLMIDLRIEKGDLEIDEDVTREASALTHKKFGTSKRLSEGDKKDITELMALKIQMSKVEWKKELDQVHELLNHQSDLNKTKDTKATELNNTVRTFLRDKAGQLASHSHDMTTTSDIISISNRKEGGTKSDERLDGLQIHLKILLKKVAACLENREFILREREKCLKILGIKDDKIPLDEVVKDQLETLPKELKASKEECLKKLKTVQRQNGTISDLEDELHKKDETIKELQAALAEKSDRLLVLQDSVDSLEKQAIQATEQKPIKKKTVNGAKAGTSNKKK